MLKIGNQTIIHHQIECCQKEGINRFVIVTGFCQDILQQHILQKIPASQVRFVENKDYAVTNTLYSLYLARNELTEDTLYFNADVMFEEPLLTKLTSYPGSSVLVEIKPDCGYEEVKVRMDKQNMLLSIGKELSAKDCAGEFTGIACFRGELLSVLRKHLHLGIMANQHNNYFEYAVNSFCQQLNIKCISTSGAHCLEIDFPEDLIRARDIFG